MAIKYISAERTDLVFVYEDGCQIGLDTGLHTFYYSPYFFTVFDNDVCRHVDDLVFI